jgi:methyltransferase (TIGR00027 family)
VSEGRASSTAFGAAVLRAVHQVVDDPPRILDDVIAPRLVGPEVLESIRADPEPFLTLESKGLRSHIVMRSRYAEDRLAAAAERGTGQYVVLGAGFDSFAYRQPSWAGALRVFEVDHVASQEAKRARLTAAGIAVPPNVALVAADLERAGLREALVAHGFDPGRPAFFSWLGVMVYMSTEAVDAIFAFVAAMPASSEVVFTFAQPEAVVGISNTAKAAAAVGEPWRTRFEPAALAQRLRRLGFSALSLLLPSEAHERYFRARRDGLRAPGRARIASALV